MLDRPGLCKPEVPASADRHPKGRHGIGRQTSGGLDRGCAKEPVIGACGQFKIFHWTATHYRLKPPTCKGTMIGFLPSELHSNRFCQVTRQGILTVAAALVRSQHWYSSVPYFYIYISIGSAHEFRGGLISLTTVVCTSS